MTSNCGFYEIFVLYVFSLYYLVKEFFSKLFLKTGLSGKLLLKCNGRTAIITGGTGGIGLETAKKLLSYGMNVIIGSHISDEEKKLCLKELRKLYPDSEVEIWHLDLASMQSVKQFASKFLETNRPLHILINNAGVMFVPYQLTEDDFESHMAINYLSHCLLTKLLLPHLQESGKTKCHARIVNVSSCLHYLGKINFDDMHSRKGYCPHYSYMQSKLAQVMFTLSSDRFLKLGGCPVTAVCVHPGVVYSRLYKHVWWVPYLGPIFFKAPAKGAEVIIYAALSAKLERLGGKYIEDCKVTKPSNYSRNIQMQNLLWNETWRLLKPWLEDEEAKGSSLDAD